MLWSTASNAFCKSMKIPQMKSLLFIVFSIFSINLVTACAVEMLFLKSKLFFYKTFWSFKNLISLLCMCFSIRDRTLSTYDGGPEDFYSGHEKFSAYIDGP